MKVKYSLPIYQFSCFVFLLVLYTPVSIIDTFLEHGPWESIAKTLIFASIGFSGYGLTVWLGKRRRFTKIFSGACLAGWTILCGGVALLFFQSRPWYDAVWNPLLILLAVILGQKMVSVETTKILNPKIFYIESVLLLLSVAVPWGINFNLQRMYYPLFSVVVYVVYFGLYAVIRNQSNIDMLTANRHYALSCLPKRIRLYNVFLVLLFLGIALLAIWGLYHSSWIFESIGSWVSHQWQSPVSDILLPDTETVSPPAAPSSPSGGSSDYEGPLFGIALFKFIFTYGWPIIAGIFLILILYLLYCNRALFWNMLCSACHAISAFFHRFLTGKQASKEPFANRTDSLEYIDQEQTLEVERKQKKEDPRKEYKHWKKEYQQYCQMKESSEKYRFGYRLARQGLVQNGAPIRPSDTPLEAVEKARVMLDSPHYANATEQYDKLYYGKEKFLSGNMSSLNESLSQIRELWKKR